MVFTDLRFFVFYLPEKLVTKKFKNSFIGTKAYTINPLTLLNFRKLYTKNLIQYCKSCKDFHSYSSIFLSNRL